MARILAALLVLITLCAAPPAPAWAETMDDATLARKLAAAQVPVDKLDEPFRTKVAEVLRQPSMYARGPVEAFPCRPAVYRWLLENPHWACRAWHALGAKGVSVEKKEDGCFVAGDRRGGELRWDRLVHERGRRIWYAEGTGRPGLLAPPVSMRAVLLLHFDEVRGSDGRIGIRHRAEVFAQFDGKTAALATKLWGTSVESAGKKTLEQLELFFSAMAWYWSENPDWARKILEQPGAGPDEQKQIEAVLRALPPSGKETPNPNP